MARTRLEWRDSLTTPTRTDFRRYLEELYCPKGEALYMLVAGFVAIAVSGLAAFFVGRPLLFPSLSPDLATEAAHISVPLLVEIPP